MIDFQEIIKQGNLYNFHTHTQFCDGRASMEEFVKAAVEQGFKHLGFTPHSPIPVQSPCNMAAEKVSDYITEFNRLKENYGSRIHLYLSMEIDFLGHYGPTSEFFDAIPLDYKLASIHFIRSFNNPEEFIDIDGHYDTFKVKMEKYFNGDIEQVVTTYYEQEMDMIEQGGFDIVGHCDKIGFNASHYREGIDQEPWYDQLFHRLFESIMDHHLIVEVNTKSWLRYNRFFPSLKYFQLLKRYQAPVLINSDAHSPSLLNAGRTEALTHLLRLSV